MNNTKEERVLVAKRDDGKYLFLKEVYYTTMPTWTDNLTEATRIRSFPRYGDITSNIKPAIYYFKNSNRMRRWLKDCHMVVVKIVVNAEEV